MKAKKGGETYGLASLPQKFLWLWWFRWNVSVLTAGVWRRCVLSCYSIAVLTIVTMVMRRA